MFYPGIFKESCMRNILCALLLAVAVTPALSHPPDPPDPPREDVLRPRIEGVSEWFLQFDLGANFNFLGGTFRPRGDGEQETDAFKKAFGLAPYFGLTLGRYFTPNFGASLGLAYDGHSVSNNQDVVDTTRVLDTSNGNIRSFTYPVHRDYTLSANYLAISLLGNLRFDKLLVYFGPSFGVPISGTTRETDAITDTSAIVMYFANDSADARRAVTGSTDSIANKNIRVSFKLGAGYMFEIAPNWSIVPQLGLDIPLTDIFKKQYTVPIENTQTPHTSGIFNAAVRHYSIQATVGLRYTF
jgi:opacity protein-like surface antigen